MRVLSEMSKKRPAESQLLPRDWWWLPTHTKGQAEKKRVQEYLNNLLSANVTNETAPAGETGVITGCTDVDLIGCGSYGYVYACTITCTFTKDGTTIEEFIDSAVKIKPCERVHADVTYFNQALTAAKPILKLNLPLLPHNLTVWHPCETHFANKSCAVIFMELLTVKLNKPHLMPTVDDGEMITALCNLTTTLLHNSVYYGDMKQPNIMQRESTPVLVDLDGLLVYSEDFYDLELTPTYFPFNHEYESLSLRRFQHPYTEFTEATVAAFENVAAYVTAVAGICTVISYSLSRKHTDMPYGFDALSYFVRTYDKELVTELRTTAHAKLVQMFADIEKNDDHKHLYTNAEYIVLRDIIINAKPFCDAKPNAETARVYGPFYTCRANFVDRALFQKNPMAQNKTKKSAGALI